MLRLSILLILLTRTRTAYVTDSPTFTNRLEKLYEKLEKLAVPTDKQVQLPHGRLYEKIDRLNSLVTDRFELSDDDEELLATMQLMGMLNAEQLDGIVKDLQHVKEKPDEAKADGEYGESDDIEDNEDYVMDWDPEDAESSPNPKLVGAGVTPSAFTKLDPPRPSSWSTVAEQLALTNQRPTIFDDSALAATEKMALRKAAISNMRNMVQADKCVPQPRWLSVRRLAPAADTVFLPPSVLLHRCPMMDDAGCCHNESLVCAPVEGKHVTIPYYVNKAGEETVLSRIVFYNHTRCDCVPSEALQGVAKVDVSSIKPKPVEVPDDNTKKRQTEWRTTTVEPILERDEEATDPPQLRRCTCPVLFTARFTETGCNCICGWPDLHRRRDCQMLARGKEHFGLRDRVCVANGDCHPPACEYGVYNRNAGHCPVKKYKRLMYRRRFQIDSDLEV